MLRQQLRPEFLNRIDDMIVFHALGRDEIARIVKLQFNRLRKKLKEQQVNVEITDTAVDYLARHGYQPEFGARPLKRLIQREIVNDLAKEILEGKIHKDSKILVDFQGGKLTFKN